MHVYRGIGHAADDELTGLRDALKRLRGYERFMAGDLLTALCVLEEAAVREQCRRPPDEEAVTPLALTEN